MAVNRIGVFQSFYCAFFVQHRIKPVLSKAMGRIQIFRNPEEDAESTWRHLRDRQISAIIALAFYEVFVIFFVQ